MRKFWTKSDLYNRVDNLMEQLDLSYKDYPLDSITIAKKFCVNLTLMQVSEFKNLCGILYHGHNSTFIGLNANRTPEMQNFDCMHELIHYFLHEDLEEASCLSLEDNSVTQNDFYEWQANEGAAQALVPYQLFIPEYVEIMLKNKKDILGYNNDILAKKFNVSEHVIINRIKGLQYEIYQYFCNNCPIENIKILSYRKLKERNFDQLYAQKRYCTQCFHILNNDDSFCMICGNKLKMGHYTRGLGYMKYKSIELNPLGKPHECPICHNEETEIEGDYCQICGTNLINRCSNSLNYDEYNEYGCSNLDSLPPNARYCPYCGSPSTYLQTGILLSWDKSNNDDLDDLIEVEDGDLPF